MESLQRSQKEITMSEESWSEALDEVEYLRRRVNALEDRVREMEYEKSDLRKEIWEKSFIINGLKMALEVFK